MTSKTGLECVIESTILKTTTSATGASWVKLGNANVITTPVPCQGIVVYNTTAAALEFGYGDYSGTAPSGEAFELPVGAQPFRFRGMKSNGGLFVRRSDLGGAQVTFKSIAERA